MPRSEDFDRGSVEDADADRNSVCTIASTTSLSHRLACLTLDFEDKLRHGHLEATEFPPVYEAEEEEEAVEMSEEQLLRELDSIEPSLQVCSRLFRDLGGSCPPLKRLTRIQIEEFREKGFIVMDNFVGRDVAAKARSEALMLFRQDRSARGDHVLWLHPGRAPATSSALAACLTALQELQADLQAVMALAQRAAEYQLAVYPSNGAQYVRHRDAFPDDGSEEGMRRVTAILYANPGWCPADGGKLRLWPPRTLEAAPSTATSAAGLLPHASLNSEGPHANGDGCVSPGEHAVHTNGNLSPAQNCHACEHTSHEHHETSSSPRALPNGHAAGLAVGLHHCLANGLANGHMGTPGNESKGSARVSGVSEAGRPSYSDADSDCASYRSSEGVPSARGGESSPYLRLDAMMQPQSLGGGGANTGRGLYPSYGSVASSVVAEATDAASLLDSLQDGVSSVDEGSLADANHSHRPVLPAHRDSEGLGIKRTEVGAEPVLDVAPLAGRLVMYLSGAVEHAVLPNLAQRVALTAWCQ